MEFRPLTRVYSIALLAMASFPVTAKATNSVAFVTLDTTTEGSWQGTYGANAYYLVGSNTWLSYAQVAVNGASTYTWAPATSDPRALQMPGGSGRVANTWFATGSFSFAVNLTDGNTHQVAIYAMDYDNLGRSERVDILDGSTGAILDSRTISGFVNGQYLTWNVTGNVTIRVTHISGVNAVVSGLFFDPASQPPAARSIFARLDSTTQGNWENAYGANGYEFAGASASLPSYAQLTVNGASGYTWAAPSSDPRALEQPGGSARVAATWFASGSFNFALNLTDGNTHQVALYAVDFDSLMRSERFDILNAATGAVLDSRSISSFSSGEYLVWNLTGNVIIRVTQLSGVNAVVSGIFFGGVPQQNTAPSPALLNASQTQLTFSTNAAGSDPTSQLLAISNQGAGTMTWSAAHSQQWLTLSSTSGTAPSNIYVGAVTAGLAAGTYSDTIVITAPGASGSPLAIPVKLVVGSLSAQFYVSPQGSPTGDGSINNPWDLQTALSQPAAVQPGATIWLRGGTYGNGSGIFYSRLVGTPAAPIIVKQFPGERATIDDWLQVGCCDQNPQASEGAYVWFWGLEFASSITDRTGDPSGQSTILDAVDTWAPGTKFINNIVHDSRVGISMWKEAVGSEAYGNVIYFNGFQASDRGHGHGFYIQNQTNTMTISNNIIFDQFDEGMQFYGTAATYEHNLLVQGNISFNNGSISAGPQMADDVIFANTNGVSGVQLLNNYFYFTPTVGLGYNELGWPGQNQDIVVQGNYFMGGFKPVAISDWASVNFQNNTVYTNSYLVTLSTASTPSGYTWDNNTYYGIGFFNYNDANFYLSGWQGLTGYDLHSTSSPGPPTGVWTFVQPNKYEPGRANIVIYNWNLAGSVSVDISGAIAVGTPYQIRDAENYFGPPIVTGIYDGAPVSIPMTGLSIATPNGAVPTTPTHTAPQFGAFVLVPLQ
jgi:hypothetical protein